MDFAGTGHIVRAPINRKGAVSRSKNLYKAEAPTSPDIETIFSPLTGKVKKGQLLLEFDMAAIDDAGRDLITPGMVSYKPGVRVKLDTNEQP